MKQFSTCVSDQDAAQFQLICIENNVTPYRVLQRAIQRCIRREAADIAKMPKTVSDGPAVIDASDVVDKLRNASI